MGKNDSLVVLGAESENILQLAHRQLPIQPVQGIGSAALRKKGVHIL
jgi:hypothetical protein